MEKEYKTFFNKKSMNEFKKFLIIFLVSAICLLVGVFLFTENENERREIENEGVMALSDYYITRGKLKGVYLDLSKDIIEGKYVPDTVKIKKELDSCIYEVLVKSFDPFIAKYGEKNVKKVFKKFKTRDQFYRKLTDEGVENIMGEVIRVNINVRKTLHPTEEDKIEVFKKCGLI